MSTNIPDFLATPYDACNHFQSRSTELVVFSPSVGEYVTIAWPTHHGRRIFPHGIKEWLRNRGLHWSCFCSLTSGAANKSTRIVESITGSIFAYCNSPYSVCGFQINLSQIYTTTIYESEFERLPLLSTGGIPDMAKLRDEFNSLGSTLSGPYFRGYCGEHESECNGITQLSGTGASLPSALQTESEEARARHLARLDEESRRVRALIVPHRRTSMAYTRIRGRSRATTSRAAAQVDNLGVPSVREQEVIDRLSGGEGCSGSELRSLIELCTSCHRYFIASLLKVHIRGCAPDV